jgi:Fe-S-cluster containining protein
MEPKFVAIDRDETFQFGCNPDVPCFNACCHDLYQVLTPYDVLRLKKCLDLDSSQFLKLYTHQAIGPETGMPVVSLRPDPLRDMACPFVTSAGCKVYPDRPGSCRMYPIARAVTRCRDTGRMSEHYALLRENHCRGFNCETRQTVDSWLSDQDLKIFNSMNDRLLKIINLKNRYRPGPLDLVAQRSFTMALYDLDGFRDHLKKNPKAIEMFTASFKGRNMDDDVALLSFGFDWVETLFSEQKL